MSESDFPQVAPEPVHPEPVPAVPRPKAKAAPAKAAKPPKAPVSTSKTPALADEVVKVDDSDVSSFTPVVVPDETSHVPAVADEVVKVDGSDVSSYTPLFATTAVQVDEKASPTSLKEAIAKLDPDWEEGDSVSQFDIITNKQGEVIEVREPVTGATV